MITNHCAQQAADQDASGDVNMIVDDDDDEEEEELAEVGSNFSVQRGIKRNYSVYRVI